MTVAEGGRLSLGKAIIEVPAQALAFDATVTIVRLDLAAEDGTGPAFAFHLDPPQQPRVPLVLHLPAPIGAEDETHPVYLAYREGSGEWASVPADREPGGTLRASVTHLSDWRSLDLFGWLSSLWRKVTEHLEGPLATPAPCPKAMPTASIEKLPATAPLSLCVTAAAAGHVTVSVFNRRHFALSLVPDPILTSPPLQLGPTGKVILPSDGRVEFDLVPNGQPVSLGYQPDAAYTAVEQLWPLALGSYLGLSAEGSAALLRGNDLHTCLAGKPTNDPAAAADCIPVVAPQKSTSPLVTFLKHLPYGPISSMLAGDATGAASITVATVLPDVGGGSKAPSPTQQTRTQTPAPPRATPTRQPQPPPPPPPLPPSHVVHYTCANDNSNIGKYVPPGHYWQNEFSAQGTRIDGGWVLIGANLDNLNHQAKVGIYSSLGTGSPVATVVVQVTGYDGERFTLPTPLGVHPGQQLYLTVVGIGDFTAYDNQSGCFIGSVEGA